MTEHPPWGDAGRGEIVGDRPVVARSTSLSLIETDTEAVRKEGLETVAVVLGIALVAVSSVRRALAASEPPGITEYRAVRPKSLPALVAGTIGGLVVGAVKLDAALMRRMPLPLRSLGRPYSRLTRNLEPTVRNSFAALEEKWRDTQVHAVASAVLFARALERELVGAVLGPLDLTDIVRTKVDIDALVDEVDLDRILARVDVDAVVDRLDLGELVQEVLDEVDLPALIRESTGTITADATDEIRYASLDADRLVARFIDRLMRRPGRHLDAPGEPLSAASSSSSTE
jgi:hypothetical protein